MNVLSVVPWDQEFGGVASVVGNLARYMSETKHQTIFMHPGSHDILSRGVTKWGFVGYKLRFRAPVVEGHIIKSLLSFLIFLPFTLIQIIYVLIINKVKIINIHYPLNDFLYFAICRKILGIKLVTSVHGADILPGGKPLSHYPIGLKLILSTSDCIVAPSLAYLVDVGKIFPSLKYKGQVIHNGVNVIEMSRNSGKIKRELGNPYILCIAAQNEKKGVDILIHAFSKLSMRNSAIQLLIVGDGPLKSQHEELTKAYGLQTRIRFLGERVRSDIVEILNGCELLVLPSKSEPFGIVIVEAMACRKPVVATMVGGIPEIIDNGKSGILVEAGDSRSLYNAICLILENKDLRESLAKEGYDKVRRSFMFEHTGAKYESLFSRICDNHRSACI